MKNSLTIRNAEVILPQSKKKVDVSVFKGRIDSIGKNIQNIGEFMLGSSIKKDTNLNNA